MLGQGQVLARVEKKKKAPPRGSYKEKCTVCCTRWPVISAKGVVCQQRRRAGGGTQGSRVWVFESQIVRGVFEVGRKSEVMFCPETNLAQPQSVRRKSEIPCPTQQLIAGQVTCNGPCVTSQWWGGEPQAAQRWNKGKEGCLAESSRKKGCILNTDKTTPFCSQHLTL